ncbi:MAG: DUF962 domain-containing protein [Lysobacteraceae bacterium]
MSQTTTEQTQSKAAVTHGFASFREFYPFYLGEHQNTTCRRLHFIGSTGVLVFLVLAIVTMNPWWLIGMPLCGYGFAWVGHFFFEHNRPATFKHPVYSLIGDWVMYRDILIGRIPF